MPIRRRIELTVSEARLRFQQLVRVTGLTGQVTVVVDGGRPVAAIVPVADLDEKPASAPNPEGWMRRIEKVRQDVRRQHAGRIGELSRALEEAWQMIDTMRPPGTDRAADTLRASHADLRKPGDQSRLDR
ncbi:type II toxin-antitoxin system prevent-host-death family antitoxin [Actinoplanes couchii]|uniref:Antitoxin n=1 Tax=Actinoplanes couchii TaxID=403638 RepID=A0ABQ3X0K4_9ACTN|nr:type II toxin-antitoxin system prevent-host-death family antitoxin [Actinoplanes couchii]MDR6316375.1 prevent-host-death family protein [Actinoplanes couchii]GID51989.1 hypothetical protein Aco03nite_003930 [Actinoplanes couchii]